ncbi:hypothetical protein CDPAHKCJ_01933 [Cobetia sp. MB87]|nr:hypothetical protein [Cobetia sp. MB87]
MTTNRIIALVREVSRSVLRRVSKDSPPITNASSRLPPAPMAAASVGVAIPVMIEPSTATISTIGPSRSRNNASGSGVLSVPSSDWSGSGAQSGRSLAVISR